MAGALSHNTSLFERQACLGACTGTSGSRLAAETALQQIEEDEGLSSGDDDFDDEELDALEEKLTQAALN